jgi:hypothetical protein
MKFDFSAIIVELSSPIISRKYDFVYATQREKFRIIIEKKIKRNLKN